MTGLKSPFLTVPRFAAVPGLVHGFGRGAWTESDFLAFAEGRGLKTVIMRQLHADAVHRLAAAPSRKLEGDALVTNVPGFLLVIRTADCLPVLLVDEPNRAVAAVHCGWRGTQERVLEKAVRAMGEAYGSRPEETLAALGPCIGAACYEVGPEVRSGHLRAGFPAAVFAVRGHAPGADASLQPPKYLLDLRAANAWLLETLGFVRANVFNAGPVCTHCEPRLLSYRRNRTDPRRMFNFIGLSS
ncbi:MAG TPA: peptidoglycan editing factor PgeF [Candidatus Aminicenantes bacterium]|nr:peptidoglycan editing factor PgeF [Candidatus Aminicenantes bacterium]